MIHDCRMLQTNYCCGSSLTDPKLHFQQHEGHEAGRGGTDPHPRAPARLAVHKWLRCGLCAGVRPGNVARWGESCRSTACLLCEDASQCRQAPETYVPGSLCPLGQVVPFLPSALSFLQRVSLTCQALDVKL